MTPRLLTTSLVLALVAWAAPASAQVDATVTLPSYAHTSPEARALLARVLDGGLVLYTRHERTDMRILDRRDDTFDINDCDTQRNLSVAGMAVGAEVGENLRVLGVPIGPVYASPTCRTRETARLLYGRSEVEPSFYALGLSREERRQALREVFARPIPEGQNMAVVAHIGNLRHLTGVALGEGDTAVLDPADMDPETQAPRVLGVIPSNMWNDFALDLVYDSE